MCWSARQETREGRDEVVVRYEIAGHFIARLVEIERSKFSLLYICHLVANRPLPYPVVSFRYHGLFERIVNPLHVLCGQW